MGVLLMIFGYIRVSTDKQFVENQQFEIEQFCSSKNIIVDKWIKETISGTKTYQKRMLGKVLKKLKKDDILICSEISRLGRSLFMIMDILNICMKKEVKVWTVKENYRLGEDIQSKVLAFAFGLSAEMERNLISQRTREALARIKAQGRKLGRAKGSKNSHSKLEGKEKLLKKYLNEGLPKEAIGKRLHIHHNTITKYLSLPEWQKYITENLPNSRYYRELLKQNKRENS